VEHVSFGEGYESATTMRTHHLAEEILAIADDSEGDWQEQRNEDGQVYLAFAPESIARARERIKSQNDLSRTDPTREVWEDQAAPMRGLPSRSELASPAPSVTGARGSACGEISPGPAVNRR
jgi:hypothetical protein